MFFGSKTPLYTSVEIIDTILSDGTLLNKQGSVVIKRKDKRKTVQTGIIYFRGSDVYAASISDKPIPIAQRVITGGMTDKSAVERIAKLAGGGSSPDVVRQVLVSNLITENLMDEYVKEHFLENVAEILSWSDCVGEWVRDGNTKDFTMPNIPFSKLKAIILSREIKKNDFAKELSRFFKPEEFEQICPMNKVKKDTSFASEIQALLEYSTGENTFSNIAEFTGIGETVVIQTFHKLWEKGIVSLKFQAIELTYEAVQTAKKKSEEIQEQEEIQRESLDLHEALLEKANAPVEDETPSSEIIDEALQGTQDITPVEHPSRENYENEEFDTDSDDEYEEDEALISGETSIIEVIKKANATDFDIPHSYEVIEVEEDIANPSTLEESDVARSEDDLNQKMLHIYEHYGFQKKDKQPKETQESDEEMSSSEENASNKSTNDFDATDFDEILAEFESVQTEPENESTFLGEDVEPVDESTEERVNDSLLSQEVDEKTEEETQEDDNNDETLEDEELISVPSKEEDSTDELEVEVESVENEVDDTNESTIDETDEDMSDGFEVDEETNNEENIENDEEQMVNLEDSNKNYEEETISPIEDEKENSPVEENSLENIELPEGISSLDLTVSEINTLPELMSKLSELQTADSLIDSEIKNQENLENEQAINDTYNKYVTHDSKLQVEEQNAKKILDSYNTKLQEIEALTNDLEEIRQNYEQLQDESTQRTALISMLQTKKDEVSQVIRQVTLNFSSKS